ncbi:MAG: c-type cytochrome [Anaerolineales bacterium]|jgi:mono/diheme cytochrome c family protein
MRRVLKWIGIVLGGLIGLILIAAVVFYIKGSRDLVATVQVPTDHVNVVTDKASQARGQELVTAFCTGCHGENLGGDVLSDDPMLGTLYSANLTAGNGGVLASHSDDDLVRSIRHGVAPDGRALIAMPSRAFNGFSAEDIGAIIAYLRSLPPVDNVVPSPKLAPVGTVFAGADPFGDMFAAHQIDHNRPFPPMPEIGANAEYGAYITGFCEQCHGADLTGGFGPNLTMSGELAGWSEDQFITTLTTGVTPSGRELDPENMPWKDVRKLDKDELQGIYMYLRTLSAD